MRLSCLSRSPSLKFPVWNSTFEPSADKNKEQICSLCVATKSSYTLESEHNMHQCLTRAIEQQFAPSLGMNGSPHVQAVLTLGLHVPAWSAKGSSGTGLNNLLNGLHTMTVIVREKERTLSEHRQTWRHTASITTLWPSLTSPLCHSIFEEDLVSSHLQVPVRATAGLQAASLMTGLIPYTLCSLRIREPCSSLSVCSLTASAWQMANGKCC